MTSEQPARAVRQPRFVAPAHPAIVPVRAFDDNYIWLIGSRADPDPALIAVDPGDAGPVIRAIDGAGGHLAAILVTHHHRDHTGGIDGLLERWPAARVVGPQATPHPRIAERVGDGDRVEFASPALQARVITVPGHTLDHIAYVCERIAGHPATVVFCGDTLFAAGCGRLFEGTPQLMAASLDRLAALPPETAVYCAHEYTLSNLRFALAADPANPELAERFDEARRWREHDRETVPTTIAIERATNPFLRAATPGVIAALREREPAGGRTVGQDAVANFAALRHWKDGFRG